VTGYSCKLRVSHPPGFVVAEGDAFKASSDLNAIFLAVYSIFVLDLLQTAFGTHYAWWVLVDGWGNPWTLRFTPRTLGLVPILTGLSECILQIHRPLLD
jgi:hypothetical protein